MNEIVATRGNLWKENPQKINTKRTLSSIPLNSSFEQMQVNTNGVTSALRAFKETCFRNRNSAIRRSSKFFKFILMSLVRLPKQLLIRHVVVYATGTQIFADKKHEISLLCSHSSLLCSFVGLRLIWWKRSWTSPSGTSPSLDEVFHTADDSLQDEVKFRLIKGFADQNFIRKQNYAKKIAID